MKFRYSLYYIMLVLLLSFRHLCVLSLVLLGINKCVVSQSLFETALEILFNIANESHQWTNRCRNGTFAPLKLDVKHFMHVSIVNKGTSKVHSNVHIKIGIKPLFVHYVPRTFWLLTEQRRCLLDDRYECLVASTR